MGRSFGGFLPQNEVIKLQWKALEACQVHAAALAYQLLFRDGVVPQPRPEDDGSEDESGLFRGFGNPKD